jgi:hypothetical protein
MWRADRAEPGRSTLATSQAQRIVAQIIVYCRTPGVLGQAAGFEGWLD